MYSMYVEQKRKRGSTGENKEGGLVYYVDKNKARDCAGALSS